MSTVYVGWSCVDYGESNQGYSSPVHCSLFSTRTQQLPQRASANPTRRRARYSDRFDAQTSPHVVDTLSRSEPA
jgi:hypothetical protein